MAMNVGKSKEPGDPRCRILVAGVGGGAGNVLDHVLAGWVDPPTVAVVNTDARALADSGISLQVMMGRTIAKGMGAGGDAELGRLAANEDLDALRSLVADYDLLILVACLGGGTGTGAAPVLARLAREEGLLTLAYVTTPFAFEGARRQEQAQEGVVALRQHADAVISLPNQRLHSMLPPGTPLVEAFAFVDRMMGAGIQGLWTLLARDNMLNLDFSDLQTLVENSGNECCFGYGEGNGTGKVEQALDELLEGSMLEKGRVIANSGAMILSVTGGPDLALSELERIHHRFQEAARPGVPHFDGGGGAGRVDRTVGADRVGGGALDAGGPSGHGGGIRRPFAVWPSPGGRGAQGQAAGRAQGGAAIGIAAERGPGPLQGCGPHHLRRGRSGHSHLSAPGHPPAHLSGKGLILSGETARVA
jgi:cell division protein FtsZ